MVKGTNFVNLKDACGRPCRSWLYNEQGADELVFLDITASSDKRYILRDLVKTAAELFIPFTVGGGINDIETIKDLLQAGADKVSINTAAIRNPDLIKQASSLFGAQCIVVAIDARQYNGENKIQYDLPEVAIDSDTQWEVYSHGGRHPTGIDAVKWAKHLNTLGAGEILLTSMDKDGTKSGYDIDLTKTVSNSVTIPVIASGGAGTCDHISEALEVCEAALLASLLHFRELSINQIKEHCIEKGISIRK